MSDLVAKFIEAASQPVPPTWEEFFDANGIPKEARTDFACAAILKQALERSEDGHPQLFEPRYMMATKADHQLGDISRDEPDFCWITGEDEDNYIGHWITGFGFVNVKFPKETTRDLTPEEQAEADKRFRPENFRISGF